jgi:hypothetical protein
MAPHENHVRVERLGAPVTVKAAPDYDRRFTDLSAFEECLKLVAKQLSIGDKRGRRAP